MRDVPTTRRHCIIKAERRAFESPSEAGLQSIHLWPASGTPPLSSF
jgi:hypothetical protein